MLKNKISDSFSARPCEIIEALNNIGNETIFDLNGVYLLFQTFRALY